MQKFYPFVLSSLLFGSCATRIDYVGNTYAPSRQVDVYIEAASIKKPYTIIGKGYPTLSRFSNQPYSRLQAKSIQKAMERGADAILLTDNWREVDLPATTMAEARSDSSGSFSRLSSIGPRTAVVNQVMVYFLKYQ